SERSTHSTRQSRQWFGTSGSSRSSRAPAAIRAVRPADGRVPRAGLGRNADYGTDGTDSRSVGGTCVQTSGRSLGPCRWNGQTLTLRPVGGRALRYTSGDDESLGLPGKTAEAGKPALRGIGPPARRPQVPRPTPGRGSAGLTSPPCHVA